MIYQRNGIWILRRRVPEVYHKVEKRREIRVSLKTASRKDAVLKAELVWSEFTDGWEASLNGDRALAEHNFRPAKRTAQRAGVAYLPAQEVAALPLAEIIDRAAIAEKSEEEATAALGLADQPPIRVSDVLEIFWPISSVKTKGKTCDQMRRWRNPRIKSYKLFEKVVGNKPIGDLTRDDMLVYREYLQERINRGEISPASVNKDIIHFVGPIKSVNKLKQHWGALHFNDM